MKTDTIFFKIFQSWPEVFFELLDQPLTEAKNYEFKSVEIKETIKRIDGVFVPTTRSRKPIYFVEVQFQFDQNFYYRLFTEIFLYLGQNESNKDWLAVPIFSRRSIEPAVPRPYNWLMESPHVRRLYLDELGATTPTSLGLEMIKLIVAKEATAQPQSYQQLIEKAQQQLEDKEVRRKVLELIETILIYKFPQMSRQELESMFALSELKQTRYFQEVRQEAKLETVPRLLQMGLTIEQIATALELDIEMVRKTAEKQSPT